MPIEQPWSDAELARLRALREGGARKKALLAAFPNRGETVIYTTLAKMFGPGSKRARKPPELPKTISKPCLGHCGLMYDSTGPGDRICAPCTALNASHGSGDLTLRGVRFRER